MERPLAKWFTLMSLAFPLLHAITPEEISHQKPIEFGARLRPYSSSNDPTAHTYNAKLLQSELYFPLQKEAKSKLLPLKNNATGDNYLPSARTVASKGNHRRPVTSHTSSNTGLKPYNIFDKPDNTKKPLVQSQNLQFNKIEPYWPFSNISSMHFSNGFKTISNRNSGFPFEGLPERFKDTTFFFSHIGPNSFEYRAQFHHGQNEFKPPKFFKPFVEEYPDFPKITFPPFPSFPEPPDIFRNKPQFPDFPNLGHVQFPTIAPPIKRILHSTIEQNVPEKTDFGSPFKPYDLVLGDISTKYPKIFRFNEERINIEDFEKQKKLQMKINGINNIAPHDNVQRDHLLILHGGIFTVKEPPLYHRKVFRKRRQRLRNSNRISS